MLVVLTVLQGNFPGNSESMQLRLILGAHAAPQRDPDTVTAHPELLKNFMSDDLKGAVGMFVARTGNAIKSRAWYPPPPPP